jgi:hypothetical protein
VYQLTADGEAAEQACARFSLTSTRVICRAPGCRKSARCRWSRNCQERPADSGRFAANSGLLDALLEDLSITAQSFIDRLNSGQNCNRQKSEA